MSVRGAWTNRIKAVVLGLGLGLAFHTSANWWKIYATHVPECGKPNCIADFVTFYSEGRLALEDRHSLYNLDKQLAYQNKVASTERVLPFVYPPITASLFAPFALMSFSTAFLTISIINIALLWASVRLLIRNLPLTQDQSHWLWLFALCNFGTQAAVFYGQTSAIILFFLTRHILAQKRASGLKAGVWAGLLCVKPQYLLIPYLVLFLRRYWAGLLVGIMISAILIVGAFIVIGGEASKQYLSLAQRMVSTENDWWNDWRAMHNLRVLTTYWLPARFKTYVWLAGCVLLIVPVIASNFCAGKSDDNFAAIWVVNILALLLVIPHLFTHDLTLLILPCALLLSLFKDKVPIFIGLGLVSFAALPSVSNLFPTMIALALLILYILSVALLWRNWRPSPLC